MINLVVIIPLHVFNEEVENLLYRAVKSVPDNIPIILSISKNVSDNQLNDLNNFTSKCKNHIEIVVHSDDKSDFCTLVNSGVNLNYEWFSILEYDDEFNALWFKDVEKEIEYKNDVSIFLPLTELIDYNTNKFVSYGNEAPWASSFSNEIGYIDNESLQQYFDFYLTGGLFNTKDWINIKGLKPDLKLTFWYEFLLRMTHKQKKVFVVPKLGYKHYVNRKDSLYDFYSKNISQEESNEWYEKAKQEYLK